MSEQQQYTAEIDIEIIDEQEMELLIEKIGPRGPRGYTGETGATPDIQIGTITTLNAGAAATASMTGTAERPVLNLGIPQGYAARITSQSEQYQVGNDNQTVPTGTWMDNRPTTPAGKALWTKRTITWADNTTTVLIYPAHQGIDGSGLVNSATLGQESISPDANGNLDFPVDANPTENSTALLTSGRIYTAIESLNTRIDNIDPEAPSPVFADVPFSLLTSDWTLDSNTGLYNAVVTNTTLLTANAGIQVFYTNSFRTALAGDIYVNKSTGYVTFTTTEEPQGTLAGFIRIIDSVSGLVPVQRGGTGAATPRQARANLNAPIRDIPVSFGTVSSLPQTIYDPDIRANMKGFGFVFSNPSAFPSGIDITFADPTGNLAGAVTISGTMATGAESTVSFWAHEERTAAEGTETAQDVQRVQDFVQTNEQTLTAEQKTQVLENIGAASNASLFYIDASKYHIIEQDLSVNSSYTAIADGHYVLRCTGRDGSAAAFYADSSRTIIIYSNATNNSISAIIPLKKNQTIYTRNLANTLYHINGYFE